MTQHETDQSCTLFY